MTSAVENMARLLANREDPEAERDQESRMRREAAGQKEQQKEARLATVCAEAGRLVDAGDEDAERAVKMRRDCVLEMAPQDSIHSIGLFPGELKGFFQKQLGMPSNFNTVYGWDRTPGSDLLKAEQAAGAVQSAFVAAVESAGPSDEPGSDETETGEKPFRELISDRETLLATMAEIRVKVARNEEVRGTLEGKLGMKFHEIVEAGRKIIAFRVTLAETPPEEESKRAELVRKIEFAAVGKDRELLVASVALSEEAHSQGHELDTLSYRDVAARDGIMARLTEDWIPEAVAKEPEYFKKRIVPRVNQEVTARQRGRQTQAREQERQQAAREAYKRNMESSGERRGSLRQLITEAQEKSQELEAQFGPNSEKDRGTREKLAVFDAKRGKIGGKALGFIPTGPKQSGVLAEFGASFQADIELMQRQSNAVDALMARYNGRDGLVKGSHAKRVPAKSGGIDTYTGHYSVDTVFAGRDYPFTTGEKERLDEEYQQRNDLIEELGRAMNKLHEKRKALNGLLGEIMTMKHLIEQAGEKK